MPMPVFFKFGEREVGLTDDEARDLASRLPPETLHNHIMMRVGVNDPVPVQMDVGGDEEGNLRALYAAIEALDGESDLSPAVKNLRRCTIAAMDELGIEPGSIA
jgi:hypothetical protein